MPHPKREPATACEWIDEAIEKTNETERSYKKIIEAIELRKIKTAEVPEAIYLVRLSEEAESALRTIRRIDAQERGHLDFLEMVKKELKCE